jgi:hypothetical protein
MEMFAGETLPFYGCYLLSVSKNASATLFWNE